MSDGPWVAHRPAAAGGGGPTVVFVHGAMDRSASFAKVTRRLPDLPVVRYDRRGYGRSAHLAPAADADAEVADLLALVGDGAVVVGHSVGALVALAAASTSDRVLAVLALEPPMPWRSSSGASGPPRAAPTADPGDVAEAFLRRMIGDVAWSRLPERTRADRRAEGPALVADLTRYVGGRPYRPEVLAGRLVVGVGGRTDARHREDVQALLAEVPGAPEAVIEGATHGMHRSHPEATAAVVRRTVERAAGVATLRP